MAEYTESPVKGSGYRLYTDYATIDTITNIDKAADSITPLLARGEAAISAQLADLATIDPGQLDQSRLMAAQMNMARWQLAAQLLSNFLSGIASGLKNTVQNVGR